MDDEVEDSQVLRQLLLQGHAIDDDLDEDMDSESELSSQQSAVESQAIDVAAAATETSTATTWSCSRCTYENTMSSSICEICGSPKEVVDVTSSGASSSSSTAATNDGRWECAACTLLNPRQVHVCAVCSTPNPAAMGAARSQRGFGVGSALGLFERVDREASSQVGISSAALEALASDKNGSIKLVDALQTMTHNLAMMEASSEGGLGLLMGRPKVSTKNDPNLIPVLSSILSNASKFDLQPRLLACQSLNYLIKMDVRMSDGKKAQEYMTTYLGVMDEIAVKHQGGNVSESSSALSTEKHLAEEATNGLEVACQSHPVAFRELCQPDPLTKLLRFLMFANSLHVNVLLTTLSLLQKVCQKVHFHTKAPQPPAAKRKAHQPSSDKATAPPTALSTIMTALETYIGHANPRVQVGAIKSITILYHRTPLHDHLSKACIRQMLHIAVAPSSEDTYDASRAAVALLSELVDESSTVLTTLLDPGVVEPLLQQLAPMLQTEAVATSTLRFLSKVVGRIGHQAGGEAKASMVLHRLLVAFVKANAVSTVSALLKDGANLHATTPVSPFVVAVTDSSIAMVRLLIRKGAHVSVEALHAAALAKRCDVVSLLLQHGASPNAANDHGETLHQVLAKHPSSHPVAKLLAVQDHARFDMHTMDHDHDHGECDGHRHTPRLIHRRHPDHAAADDGASEGQTPPAATLDGSSRRDVLLSEFTREWNDMDTEEDESEHFDDDDMHSDDDDEFHDMYHDDDESHEEDDDDDDGDEDGEGNHDDEMPAPSHDDGDETKHDHAVDVHSEDAPPVAVRREDAVAFTHALFTSLVHAVPAVDNKQVTYAVLSTMANVLIYPIELTAADINVLLEVIHGLLMESNDTPAKADEHTGQDTDLNVYAMVLALRLLEALSTVNNGKAVVGQMERQGILDRLRSFAAQTHASPVDATVGSLVTDWLDTVAPLSPSASIEANPVVGRLNALCDGLTASSDVAAISHGLDSILTCIDAGVTTYELTQSAVVPTLLHALSRRKVSWNPKLPALVRHLHQVVGLHESLPTVSYAMAKGKEFYPLTRQLRCRMRLLPPHQGDAAAASRSIHASPLTLFSSFERTVLRCAPISDPKWVMYAWSLVGQSIWKPVDGKWVEATVCGFDASTGCHLLHFRDEFVEEVLQEEAYRLVKAPIKVYASVSMDLSSFGTTSSSLKRRTPDDNTSPMRRSKRIKRRVSDEAAASRDDQAAPSSEERPQPPDARSREKRLMDVLRLQASSAPAEGDKVWVSNGSNICVCGTYTRKAAASHVEVEVSFGSQLKVPLVVAEANLVSFQAKARPGSASSKVQRMLSALDSQGRNGGGRPVLEHLRRLLARSRPDHVDADESPSAAGGSGGAAASSGTPSGSRRGKQKAVKPSPPSIQYEGEQFTVTAPPVVRVLLGYGDYSDKSEDQLHWLTSDGDHLNDKAIPVARWLFHVFADGQKPKTKPETLDTPSPQHVSWSLAVFGTFCKELRLGLMSSEEWMVFSRHSTAEADQDVLTWTGFSALLVALCKEPRHMRCLWQYLEHLGFKTSTFQPAPTVPSHLVEFAPDDNLFYCLHKIHPTQSLGLLPWKCVFNVFCDFAVRWSKDGASNATKPAADVSMTDAGESTHGSPAFTQSVDLLRVLHDYFGGELTKDTWLNPRLSRKLRMQLQDVLSVTSGTYPAWCDELVQQSKFFFPLDMRYTLFRTTAFGFSRSLHWFRDHLDHDSTNDDLSISPLPKERAKVDRVDIVKSADAVMKVHAKRKAILDIVFVGERGYGSGVTAAFYSAVANALQCNKALRLWVGGHEDSTDDVIRHPNGLFPLPVLDAPDALKDRFRLMGRLAGKALQDERLLPLPLSSHFLNLVFGQAVPVDELATIFLEPGRILLDLNKAAQALRTGRLDVMIDNMPAHEWLAAVDLNFVDPITQAELESNGSAKSVTVDNLHVYVDLVLRSWLDRGVAAQVQAFQEGLSEVVALKKLQLLFVDELQLTLCGTVDVEWTKESLRQTIKLAHGYTSASEPIEHLIDVLVDMTTAQRRAFLLYATGCPNLPPGGVGFEKLKPQFEVVRRVSPDGDPVDKTLPFARTCTNTLHLPAYSSKAILAQQLEYAVVNSKGVIDRD